MYFFQHLLAILQIPAFCWVSPIGRYLAKYPLTHQCPQNLAVRPLREASLSLGGGVGNGFDVGGPPLAHIRSVFPRREAAHSDPALPMIGAGEDTCMGGEAPACWRVIAILSTSEPFDVRSALKGFIERTWVLEVEVEPQPSHFA